VKYSPRYDFKTVSSLAFLGKQRHQLNPCVSSRHRQRRRSQSDHVADLQAAVAVAASSETSVCHTHTHTHTRPAATPRRVPGGVPSRVTARKRPRVSRLSIKLAFSDVRRPVGPPAVASSIREALRLVSGVRRAAAVDARDRTFAPPLLPLGGSVAEWLACWTRAQKSPGSNRSRDAVR